MVVNGALSTDEVLSIMGEQLLIYLLIFAIAILAVLLVFDGFKKK